MAYEHIEVSLENGLGTITLNKPPVNVLNIAMMEEMNQALDSWKGDKDLKVILFNAKGKCFSAGVDVGEHMGDLATKMIEVFHGIFRRMDQLGALTVASVYSSCLGGGCELAVFCDLAIASESAKFGQPEIQVGVFPPIAAQIMPRIIGRKAAAELIFSGKIISADEAFNSTVIIFLYPTCNSTEPSLAIGNSSCGSSLRFVNCAFFIGFQKLIFERTPSFRVQEWLGLDPHPPIYFRVNRLQNLESTKNVKHPLIQSIKDVLSGFRETI